MPFLELFDETLDINSTENYELSVQASFDSLSFAILDTLRNKFVMLRDYEPDDNTYFDVDRIREILSKDDFLAKHYKKVNLITPSPRVTLVPTPLFDITKKDEYFIFNQPRKEGDIILTNELTDPDATLIFAISDKITDLLKSSFPKAQLYHQLKPLFQYISVNRRSAVNYYIQIHLERDFFNLIIFDQNILKLCNTFQYKTLSDIQYYSLYVIKRMNINHQVVVFFSGRTNNFKEIIFNFSDYLKTIKFAEPSGNFTFSYVFNDTVLNKFLNLFSATNCG